MEVICLQTKAFHALIDEVVNRIQENQKNTIQDKWISEEEGMHMLRVKSKTTMSLLRNNGEIRFSQPRKKIIMYDRDSINAYLEKHAT